MDSLQGIAIEYKLDAFNMPHTGTTLCHLKIGYVNVMPLFRKRHIALNSPLGHLNGDNTNSPPDSQNYMVTLKFNPLTHPTTHAAISTFSTSHNAISSPYSQSNSAWVLQHQKQTQYSMLQIKPISKNTFRLPPSYFISPSFNTKLQLAKDLPNLAMELHS